jgi:hypothetical protein
MSFSLVRTDELELFWEQAWAEAQTAGQQIAQKVYDYFAYVAEMDSSINGVSRVIGRSESSFGF